jgi:NAD(P)-dependent dehydrogenase (short-subunit alcohol dehydrogenase family)
MKSVVVTGASSGIGWACTKILIANGYHVFGSVRKTSDGERLKAKFAADVTPLIFDVTDESAVHRAAEQVRAALGGEKLFGLVNNAGIAVSAPLLHQPISEYRMQIEVNLIGPLIVSQAFIPLLGADRNLKGQPGRVINISSVAGKNGFPFLGAYAASKHGLEGFSESLRRELMLYGIDVIIIGPGSIATPIWDKAEMIEITPYLKTEYGKYIEGFRDYILRQGKKGLSADQVGCLVLKALTAAKPKVRYAIVPSRLINWTIPMLLPKRWVDKIIARNLKIENQASAQVSAKT